MRPLRFGLHGLARLPRHAGRGFFPRARPPDHAPRRSAPRDGRPLGRRGARPRGPGGGGRRGHAPRLSVGHGDQRHGPDPGTFRPSARRGAEIGFGEPRRFRARTRLYPRQSPQLRPRAGGRADDRARTLAVVRRGHLRHGGDGPAAGGLPRRGCATGGSSRFSRWGVPRTTRRCG